MDDSAQEIALEVRAVGRISAVPTLLRVLCETTGMGFAAVARVTQKSWTLCAVHDDVPFGVEPGGQLAVEAPCFDSRAARTPIVIERASTDAACRAHPAPSTCTIESCVSVPIVLGNGRYFGTLCAVDPAPASLTDPRIRSMFERFAEFIALQLDTELARDADRARLLDERAAAELQEQLHAILGHDLRNPLQAVYASGELLERKLTDPALAKIAARIRVNARRVSALVDTGLDLARSRLGGALGLQLQDVEHLGAALSSLVREFQEAAPGRDIVAEIEVNRTVRCDLGRVRQVVSNLVSNALTHGVPNGRVTVSARFSGETLVIAVRNAGVPIPPDGMARLFQPFWRSSTSATRQGLGLGLFICGQVVRAHGGEIGVASTAGEGTTFTVRLPQSPLA